MPRSPRYRSRTGRRSPIAASRWTSVTVPCQPRMRSSGKSISSRNGKATSTTSTPNFGSGLLCLIVLLLAAPCYGNRPNIETRTVSAASGWSLSEIRIIHPQGANLAASRIFSHASNSPGFRSTLSSLSSILPRALAAAIVEAREPLLAHTDTPIPLMHDCQTATCISHFALLSRSTSDWYKAPVSLSVSTRARHSCNSTCCPGNASIAFINSASPLRINLYRADIMSNCSFEEAMSFSNESASLRAVCATDSAVLAASLAFPDSVLAASATPNAVFASSMAAVESLRAFAEVISNALISAPSSVCRWREKTYTPASEKNSPNRPTTTIKINTSFGHFIHRGSLSCSSRYSPIAPHVRIRPDTIRKISDTSRAVSVPDLDAASNNDKYPISAYDLLGAVGIALTGVALAILYLSTRCRSIKPPVPRAGYPLPTQQPSQPHPKGGQLLQPPSPESPGECDES